MAVFKLKFAMKDGRFYICAAVPKTTTRYYKRVEGLVDPNFRYWNPREQVFTGGTFKEQNNQVLDEYLKKFTSRAESDVYSNGTELFSKAKPIGYERVPKQFKSFSTIPIPSGRSRNMTFGEFAVYLINTMKTEALKKPSRAYQPYINVLHKLEHQNTCVNKRVCDVNNDDFIKFGEHIRKKLKGVNYTALMKGFKAIINKAHKMGVSEAALFYPYAEDAPTKEVTIDDVIGGIDILTEDEYQEFIDMDLSQIEQSGCRRDFYRTLYRDFCIFLYEMKMRPADVIKAHKDMIRGDKLIYCPEKKKNYSNQRQAFVVAPITPIAHDIIKKYRKQSICGYIFPFAMNDFKWDFNDPTIWNRWMNRKQATIEKINKFLRKVKDVLDVKELTTYTFRHSAITHAINKGEKPIMQIAKEAGTSVSMIEKHYYNYFK